MLELLQAINMVMICLKFDMRVLVACVLDWIFGKLNESTTCFAAIMRGMF